MKTSMQPATIPGRDKGQGDAGEGAQRAAAEVFCGFEQGQVHLLQIGVQRHDHERQVAVDDAQIGGEIGLQHDDRLIDDAQPEQEVVEQAVVLEDADPGVDAQQEGRPEGQNHQHQQNPAPAGSLRAMA
jgi:hypothetical protein